MTTIKHDIKDNNSENLTIELKSVSKSFDTIKAVKSLSFKVKQGEVIGFLGPNGSGKTTTMRLLTSFYNPDSGNIKINGIDTQENDIHTRNSIGYLAENNPLYEDLLVKEYLEFVADIRGLTKTEKKENIANSVEEIGLKDVYFRPINQLSKGYHQRVGLAQAILHDPSILILDEPTEGLDPNQRLTHRNLIKTLGEKRTVLLSTHVMQEVETTCERVILLSKGTLVADQPVKDLLNQVEGLKTVYVEIDGNNIEKELNKLPGLHSIEVTDTLEKRKGFTISVVGDIDPRPEIYKISKSKNWIIWELHEIKPKLEEIFRDLTTQNKKL